MMDRAPYHENVTIIGVGLLGASLGMAIRRHNLARRITGCGRNRQRLLDARSQGAIDAVSTDLSEAVSSSDLIILCTPVQHIIENLPTVMRAAEPGALVTDVGSTKGAILRVAASIEERGVTFIGSHPMAGSDRTGHEHGTPDLYEGATTFITVEETTPKDKVAEVSQLWRSVGARAVLIHPERHDRLVAAISHLPHLLAVATVRMVSEVHDDENFLRWVIGGGFRDTTRIAKGSSEMWRDICATNPQAIVEAIDALLEKMQEIRHEIASTDMRELTAMLEEARRYREGLEDEA
ncbi:prephenate dehydrogenase/arogenate dehydrogenase family protein [Candidatus Sumerlaeota bacterium]|nr:prephenate dehydrogenase/arogenate dehydrogenase family protein [Candidatus Sumerlaeota bacterium]